MLWFYEKSSNDALLMLVLFYCSSLILSNILVTIFFFAKNRALIPQRHFFSKDKIIDILSLGGNFFIIQIAVLLIFTTDNFLILQLLGPKEVTVYNVVFKLFSTFNIVFGILISPIWSAFTEAYEKKDFVWIKSTLRRLKLVFVIILLGLIFMFFIYQDIINFWLPRNERIYPPFSLIVSLALFVAISVWNNIYSYFLNGVGEVIMQRKTAIIGAIVNIPLAIILVKYLDLGLTGIVYSMCACLFIFSIVGPIETFRFINKNNVK
jgi:O-antigen/teichoic acid export membrane protein